MTPDVFAEAAALIKAGDRAAVEQLLIMFPELPAEHDANGVSLTLLAMYHRQNEIADLLAKAHPGPGWFESAALGLAERVEEMLENKPERLDSEAADGFTALHLACYFGQEAVALVLINAGADVDAVSGNPAQLRPLHAAAASRSVGIAEALLAAGAEVAAQQASGHTAIDAARQNQDQSMIDLLSRRGA